MHSRRRVQRAAARGRAPADDQPIARISDGIGTQHLRSGVLIVDLADEERGILVRPDEILALIEDLEYYLETQPAPATVAAA
jgi:hypothetical protein